MIGKLFIIILMLIALYLVIGTVICWFVSWAGDEKFSLNGVTFKFILAWPRMFFTKVI